MENLVKSVVKTQKSLNEAKTNLKDSREIYESEVSKMITERLEKDEDFKMLVENIDASSKEVEDLTLELESEKKKVDEELKNTDIEGDVCVEGGRVSFSVNEKLVVKDEEKLTEYGMSKGVFPHIINKFSFSKTKLKKLLKEKEFEGEKIDGVGFEKVKGYKIYVD